LKSQWFGIQEGCPVCDGNEQDTAYWADYFTKLVKETPMFMNSPNMDKDSKDNNEANKFPIIDRYMLVYKDWMGILAQVDESRKKISWEEKKDNIYWRGSTSGMNQTHFGSEYNKVPCEKMADILNEMPSDYGQSMWPRLSFLLNSRDKPDDIDAKFSVWIPHFK